MNTMVVIGIVLIILGIVALAYQGFSYKTEERVVDMGPIKADVEKEHTVPLPPVIGGAAVIGGLALILIGARRGRS